MEKIFHLIEERGYGIEYIIFTGTEQECLDQKSTYLSAQKTESETNDQTSTMYRNGNLDSFTYRIQSSISLELQELKKLNEADYWDGDETDKIRI